MIAFSVLLLICQVYFGVTAVQIIYLDDHDRERTDFIQCVLGSCILLSFNFNLPRNS